MQRLVLINHSVATLEGMLTIPEKARSIVVFAHGSGSSRFSPRNNFVATILNHAGIATLLIDLLSQKEDETYETRFDITLLTTRLCIALEWLERNHDTQGLEIGLFGASTGAASALQAAVKMKKSVKALVSRGGRPDLAGNALESVAAPTLFIVGGLDSGVIELNQTAYNRLTCVKKFTIIANATHLFEEPGCLEEVARLATMWFQGYLIPSQQGQGLTGPLY